MTAAAAVIVAFLNAPDPDERATNLLAFDPQYGNFDSQYGVWLEDVVEGAGAPLGCALCMSSRDGTYWLTYSREGDDGLVSCGKCGVIWPLTPTAVVDLAGDWPTVVTGELPSLPDTCEVCACTDEAACATPDGPCGWERPGLCSACAEAIAMAVGP
jgi:hypothetical protein